MFTLPDLPYGYDALQPTMSSETLHLHHDKHHARYVDTTNEILKGSPLASASLEDVIAAAKRDGRQKLFNNAAQAWNHGFFWLCMTPAPRPPSGELASAIDRAFGDMEGLKTKFVEAASDHFGSGWAWITAADGELSVLTTHDAGLPIGEGGPTPILVCDLWEHAYYLDYRNDRAGFLKQWWDKLANWSFAEQQFAASGEAEAWRYPSLAA